MKLGRIIGIDKAKHQSAFALVVTLVLMVLLLILAVGLLSLSSVSLRTASHVNAMSLAKSNARLALMLAIGELQKAAGPDQRITATGSIMADAGDSVGQPNITGVWESWKIDPDSLPTSSDDYRKSEALKTGKFLKWLVSSAEPNTVQDVDFPNSASGGNDSIQLMPEIEKATMDYPSGYPALFGERVLVADSSSNTASGGFAYAVMDEGTKARVDTGYREPDGSKVGDFSMTLGSGVRADISKITEMEGFTWDKADLDQNGNQLAKATSIDGAKMLYEEISGATDSDVMDLQHDITVSSAGVFSDVANGGLRKDLNSILNADDLPSSLAGRGIYETQMDYSLGYNAATGDAEPRWEPLRDFCTVYQDAIFNASGAPYLRFAGTEGWDIANYETPPAQTNRSVIMPTVSKVQIFFSIVACPLRQGSNGPTDPWVFANSRVFGGVWNNGGRYLLNLIYTPVITLHNPYNVALEVPELSVEFKNVPLSIQVSRSGGPWLPSSPGGVQSLHQGSSRLGYNKTFKFTIKDSSGTGTAVKMQPGELVTFSPDIPETASFQSERSGAYDDRTFLDTMDSGAVSGGELTGGLDTKEQDATRGSRGEVVGYALDYINLGRNGKDIETYHENGVDAWKYSGASDTFRIKFRATPDSRVNASERGVFGVVMSNGADSVYSALNFDFPTTTDGVLVTGLEDALDDNTEYIFPKTGSLTIGQIAVPNSTTPIIDFPSNCFAMVTATSKTTLANQDGSNYEGRYATKPWSFTSPGGNFLKQHIEKDYTVDQSAFPYELDVIQLDPSSGYGSDRYVTVDNLGRGVGFTGHTTIVGKQFATVRDVPLAPLQAMPQLNAANLGSGNNVSRFLNPVGNSWAHMMLSTSAITSAAINADMTAQYDHSFLLNTSLYDSFYFSGIAPRTSLGGGLMTSATTAVLATDFITGDREKMTDSRLIPWIPAGKSSSEIIDLLSDETTASDQAASFQMMAGAFNVNSTSKRAWKTLLASARSEGARQIAIILANTSGESDIQPLKDVDSDRTRFSRFRLPNSDSVDDTSSSIDPVQRFFQGPRDLTDDQLDLLAENIVNQVKTRGPFLSMAEFVNRQIGSTSELTLKGALQAAIDESEINTNTSDLSALFETGYEITGDKVSSSIINPQAAIGRSDQGAPGNLTQADILTVLGNAATVRSDTFRIRAYGEARDKNGNVIAKAWCEAVVQRTPDFVDSTNESHLSMDDPSLSEANKLFGRVFEIVSFRWLDDSEV